MSLYLPACSCSRPQTQGSPCTPFPTLVSPSLVCLSGHSGKVLGSMVNSIEKRVEKCIYMHLNVPVWFIRQKLCILNSNIWPICLEYFCSNSGNIINLSFFKNMFCVYKPFHDLHLQSDKRSLYIPLTLFLSLSSRKMN